MKAALCALRHCTFLAARTTCPQAGSVPSGLRHQRVSYGSMTSAHCRASKVGFSGWMKASVPITAQLIPKHCVHDDGSFLYIPLQSKEAATEEHAQNKLFNMRPSKSDIPSLEDLRCFGRDHPEPEDREPKLQQ